MNRIILLTLFTTVSLFGQVKDNIYRIEGHNNSTVYSYSVDVLSLSTDGTYEWINQEAFSKKLMRQNVIFNYKRSTGTYVKKGNILYLTEKENGRKYSFSFLSENKLVRLIDDKEKSKHIWKKVKY